MRLINISIFTAIVLLSVQFAAAQMVGTPYITSFQCLSTDMPGKPAISSTMGIAPDGKLFMYSAQTRALSASASSAISPLTYAWTIPAVLSPSSLSGSSVNITSPAASTTSLTVGTYSVTTNAKNNCGTTASDTYTFKVCNKLSSANYPTSITGVTVKYSATIEDRDNYGNFGTARNKVCYLLFPGDYINMTFSGGMFDQLDFPPNGVYANPAPTLPLQIFAYTYIDTCVSVTHSADFRTWKITVIKAINGIAYDPTPSIGVYSVKSNCSDEQYGIVPEILSFPFAVAVLNKTNGWSGDSRYHPQGGIVTY